MPGTRRLNVFEGHCPPGMFWVNRPAQKAVAVKDPNFGDITRIIANGDRLADLGSQREIHITQPLKVHAVSANHTGLRNHDQEQVQSLQTLRHTRQPPWAKPRLDGWNADFTMWAVVIGAQEIVTDGGIELRQRESWRCRGFSFAEIPRKLGETFRIQCPKEPLNLPSALRPSDSRIDQLAMEVCRDLREMRAGEITAMIDMEHVRNTADGPRGILFAPHRLA
jgi:hypothetical protein